MQDTTPTAPVPARDDAQLLEIDLSTLVGAVLKRLPLCLGICGAVTATALAYCIFATPVYLPNCRMLIEPGNLKVTQIQEVYDTEFGHDSRSRDAFMQTQMKLITSDHLLSKVFEHFHLAEKPPFNTAREPLRALETQIEIAQIPNTNILDIGFRHKDAAFAAEVSNFIARTYMDDSQQRASGFSIRGLEKLQEELVNMERARFAAIDKLNNYKSMHRILSVESAQKLGIARMTELDKASVNAQEALANAQASVDAIDAWRAAGKRLDSIPEAISNPTLTAYKVARLQAQTLLVKALQDFGPSHRSIAIQQQAINSMTKAIDEEIENSLISAQAKLEQARVRLGIITKELGAAAAEIRQLDQIADEYKMLDDNLKAAEKNYQLVLQRVGELQIARSADSGSGGTFQIIVPATPPQKAKYPQKPKIMVIAMLASAMFSVLLCIMLELLDTTIKTRDDVENLSTVPIFGEIPRDERDAPDLALLNAPEGQTAEAFRALRTALSLSGTGRKAKLLAITSTLPGDGKSFTTINLAITYARAGKRILLVDADLRRRRLTSLLLGKGKDAEGLSNILAQDMPPEALESLLKQPAEGMPLHFLPSGPLPANPTELLSGDITEAFLQAMAEQYDLVIIDVPPILAVADTRTLAAVQGMCYLLVIRPHATEKRQLSMSLDALATVGAKVIGTVLNHVEVLPGTGYGYKYGYKYGYGYGYGYENGHQSRPSLFRRMVACMGKGTGDDKRA